MAGEAITPEHPCDLMARLAPELRDLVRQHCGRCQGENDRCLLQALNDRLRAEPPS